MRFRLHGMMYKGWLINGDMDTMRSTEDINRDGMCLLRGTK
jgi:hypothetical protein